MAVCMKHFRNRALNSTNKYVRLACLIQAFGLSSRNIYGALFIYVMLDKQYL